MKTILVTGGAGFIGSHLCEELIASGDRVICVDNFFTGQRQNIAHLENNENFRLLEHDIIDPLDVDEDIDQIYNLACPASPPHYQKNPIRTVKANTIGVINVLGLAKKTGARVLQASTSEIYGDPEVHPQTEDYNGNVNPLSPRACYDEGKRVAETLCMDYHREHGIEIRIARIFNTYGPRMKPDDGRVVSNFITETLQNKPMSIYGDGSQTRSFCFVDDLVRGLILLMNQSDMGPINLGNPIELTMLELAKLVLEKTQSKSTVEHMPLPEADPKKRRPDITRAKKILGWQPSIGIDEGLTKTIEYFTSIV